MQFSCILAVNKYIMKPTPKELKILLDYTNYIKECVSNNSVISKKTIKKYLNEDYFHCNIFNTNKSL